MCRTLYFCIVPVATAINSLSGNGILCLPLWRGLHLLMGKISMYHFTVDYHYPKLIFLLEGKTSEIKL